MCPKRAHLLCFLWVQCRNVAEIDVAARAIGGQVPVLLDEKLPLHIRRKQAFALTGGVVGDCRRHIKNKRTAILGGQRCKCSPARIAQALERDGQHLAVLRLHAEGEGIVVRRDRPDRP